MCIRDSKRRSHHKISSLNVIEDKKSGEFRLSHHVDLKTGLYNGKQIIEPKKYNSDLKSNMGYSSQSVIILIKILLTLMHVVISIL